MPAIPPGAREADPATEAWKLAAERLRNGQPLPEQPPAPEAAPKMARIGVRLPAPTGRPGQPLAGWRASVYDLDTCVLLPVQRVDLHLDPDGAVTATVRLIVDEVTVEPGGG